MYYARFKQSKKGQNQMLFSLDIVRARKGDCLILHYGDKNDPKVVMIDGGPKSVYAPHLRPRIEAIKKARGLGKTQPLQVEMLMVSHVDDDHIQGILDLTKELIASDMSHQPPLLEVATMWHNSFENIIGSTPTELTANFTKQFGTASTNGDPPSDLSIVPKDKSLTETDVLSNLKVLASIQQGAQLRNDCNRLNFPLNQEFKGKLILAKKKGKPIDMGDGLKFTVIGPMPDELKALHEKHQQWLKDLKKKGKTAEDVLSAYMDKSVPNLSSLVVLAEVDGKTMLLTGDARGDKVLEGLKLVGLLDKDGKMKVDILKVPHHGSKNNSEIGFFENIIADHYVMSGNGEHGNPARETLEMLLAARGNEKYTVHLTYPLDETDAGRKAAWAKQHKNVKWSAPKQSIAALFKAEPAFAKKFKFGDGKRAQVIDLLEKA
jgi:hypothetical protein